MTCKNGSRKCHSPRQVWRPKTKTNQIIYLEALIDKAFIINLSENPPHTLHKIQVHSLIIVPKIDPSPSASNNLLPFLHIASNNAPAGLVVLTDPHFHNLFAARDVELLINLVLDGEAVAVPAEAARDVVAGHRLVARDDVLDGAGEYVAVVREAGGEGGAVVEDVLGEVLGESELSLEGFDFGPVVENLLLLLWEGEVLALAHLFHGGRRETKGRGLGFLNISSQ